MTFDYEGKTDLAELPIEEYITYRLRTNGYPESKIAEILDELQPYIHEGLL